ncbi:MAG: hypothetical protein H8E72_01930 [Candidatus Marinimicrobia bacterium]|nr:hypothetical protein [Candidatus Neomarinimicrobiota bacterium]
MRKNVKKWVIMLAPLILICGILFNSVLFEDYLFQGGDSLSPKAVRLGIETSAQEYGEYPLWMPWVFSGMPSVHSFQNISEYYLPHLVMKALMTMGIPQFWEFIFHFIFAAMGMILLLRYLKIRDSIAFFGGVTYMMMPYLVTMIVHGHGSQMMTTAFIPWVIWAIIRLKDSPNGSNMGILALLMGLQLQRAHVQIAYYTWMLVGLYIVMNIIFNYVDKNKGLPKFVGWAIPAFVLAITMSMWIYLPATSYTPFSIRGAGGGGGTGLEYATQWSFSMGEMLTFINPSYYGFGGATYWGNMPFTDYPNYMGILLLLFAIYGMFTYKDRFRIFLITASAFALLLSFGHHLKPFYQFFYSYFPYFNKFRVPVMILVLLQFNTVVLAALGLNDLMQKIEDRKYDLKLFFVWSGLLFAGIILLNISFDTFAEFGKRSHPVLNPMRADLMSADSFRVGCLLLLGVASIYAISRKWFSEFFGIGIITCIAIIDVGIVDKMIIEPTPESYRTSTLKKKEFLNAYLKEDSIIRFLKSDTTKFRVLPLGALERENRWSAFQIESVGGYHPAKMGNYNELMTQTGWNYPGILQMLNVKYLISEEPFEHPLFSLVHEGSLYMPDQYVNAFVYQFNGFMNRFFFAENVATLTKDETFTQMKTHGFSPQQNSFITETLAPFNYDASAKVELVAWSPNRIKIKTVTTSPQFLVMSEIYYPNGWVIDGHPEIEIIQVNNTLRGILIPEGEFAFEMVFAPSDIKYGTMLTWISLLLVLGLIVAPIVKKK